MSPVSLFSVHCFMSRLFFHITTGLDRLILTSLRGTDIFSIYVYWVLYFNTRELTLYFGVRACVRACMRACVHIMCLR